MYSQGTEVSVSCTVDLDRDTPAAPHHGRLLLGDTAKGAHTGGVLIPVWQTNRRLTAHKHYAPLQRIIVAGADGSVHVLAMQTNQVSESSPSH